MDADAVPPWAPVDPLGGVLGDLRMRGTFYCRAEGSAPWGVEMPALEGCMSFHVVVLGSCQLEVDGEDYHLRAGDLALVPHGRGYLLRSGPGVPIAGRADLLPQEMLDSHYAVLRIDGGGAPAQLVCGVLELERPGAAHLLELLPPVLVIEAGDAARGSLQMLLGMITDEVRHDRPGSEAVVTRLADAVVIQAVRGWLETGATGAGWLRALRDPQVGRAVALVHRDPGAPWTLDRLARESRMSRSAFAARFTELAGEPALRHVTRWRMHLATVELARGARVGEVARQLGYESEAAFSRAYRRVTGVPPVSVRSRPGSSVHPGTAGPPPS